MESILIFVLISIVFGSSVFAHPKSQQNNVVERSDDLFPVNIIHINDFHARYNIIWFLDVTLLIRNSINHSLPISNCDTISSIDSKRPTNDRSAANQMKNVLVAMHGVCT